MLTPSNFTCERCGDCCRYLTVRLDKEDISAIKEEDFEESFFVRFDEHIKSDVLKKDGWCVFLGSGKEGYYCKIYGVRPKVCRDYPFVECDEVESCKPELMGDKVR